MRRAVRDLFDASNLDDEQLQIAIRVAHNNLRDRKSNFNEFVQEGAHEAYPVDSGSAICSV